MLKIGIDGRALEGQRAGTGRYVYELCKELDKLLPDAQFFVYSSKPVEMPVTSSRWISRVEANKRAQGLKSVLWLKMRAGKMCREDDIDVFWANATFIPKLKKSVRVVTTVHDLAYLIVPETMKRVTYWAFKMFFYRDVKRSNAVVCNSAGTKERLKSVLNIDSVGVALPAASNHFSPASQTEIHRVKEKFGIKSQFLLAVGTLEPRKNLMELIKAFLELKNSGELPALELLLVGGTGWKNEALTDFLNRGSSDSVRALGFVPDEDLPGLYSAANAFVFPSIYEGFGIPVLEAAVCGANVAATDIPEIREAGGPDSFYFSPTESLKDVLRTLVKRKDKKIKHRGNFPRWHDGGAVLAAAITGEL